MKSTMQPTQLHKRSKSTMQPTQHHKHGTAAAHALALVLFAHWYGQTAAAQPLCGNVAVYIAGTHSNSPGQLQYEVSTEWGVFPGEPLSATLCEKPAGVLQSIKPGQYGNCTEIRGAAAVNASVGAMVNSGFPKLQFADGQGCWCSTQAGIFEWEAVWPYVHLRIRSTEQGQRDRKLARKVLSSHAVHAANFPDPAPEETPAGCAGSSTPGYTVVLDSWYRVVRDECFCQDSGVGDWLTVCLRVTHKC